MTPTFLKPIALQAKHALASANLAMGSSHLHELLAALHGFNTAIAFRSYVTQEVSPGDPPLLVFLDTAKALARCLVLRPDVDAQRVVGELTQALRQTRDPSTIYVLTDRVSDSLAAFVRRTVLQEPRMQGVDDDDAERLRATLAEGWGDNRIQRSMSLNSGPLRVTDERFRQEDAVTVLEATGTYIDRLDEEGSFDFSADFDERRPGLYALARSQVTFRPGDVEEDDDLVMDFQHPSLD